VRFGDTAGAAAQFSESLTIAAALGIKKQIAECVEGIGAIAVGAGTPEAAVRLFAAAVALRSAISASLPPVKEAEQRDSLNTTCAALGETAYKRAWREGRAMTFEGVIALALAVASEVSRGPSRRMTSAAEGVAAAGSQARDSAG